jgi:hypothetical protein
VKEEVRAARLGYFLEMRRRDLAFALRSLRKAPPFNATVVPVLGLAIGSAALIFLIVYALLLRGPNFSEADRLFMLWQKNSAGRSRFLSPAASPGSTPRSRSVMSKDI